MSNDDFVHDEIIESEVEFDDSEIVAADFDPPREMGNPSIEVTEENKEIAQMLKSSAMDAVLEGKLNESIDHLTEAIVLNPKSALLYASRAAVFVKLKKPNAAYRDADAAIEMNPNLAKAYKARGMARALLGLWDMAALDLNVASKLDFDEETTLLLKKVEANAKKLDEHHKKYERLRRERDLRRAERRRLRLSQEAELAGILHDGQVIEVKSDNELRTKLNAASNSSRLAVVYFTATWCGPSVYTDPVFERLASRNTKVVFLKVDIDEVREAAAEWEISSIPSFYLAKGGRVVDKVVDIDINSLQQKIAQHAAS